MSDWASGHEGSDHRLKMFHWLLPHKPNWPQSKHLISKNKKCKATCLLENILLSTYTWQVTTTPFP